MFKKLQTRLFVSYLLVLGLTLFLIGTVTITSLSQQQVPPEFTWSRLELLLTGFSSQQTLGDLLLNQSDRNSFSEVFDEFAERNTVRVLLLSGTVDAQRVVLYDSDAVFLGMDAPNLRIAERDIRENSRPLTRFIQFGSFMQVNNGTQDEWLYAGLMREGVQGRGRLNNITLIIAEPRSTENLRAALAEFADFLLMPLLRAALIGGLVAFGLAIFLTRSITRPLQALAQSAYDVARGQFNTEVPITGPAEVQQVAQAFNRMTGEVRAAQQSQREFVANVTHDLKTPLTSIQGYSQAIIDGAAANPAEAAEVIHDEAERLNRMVQELTDLARLQAGRLSMKLAPLDLSAMVKAIGQRLALVASRQQITLTIITDPLPPIAADGDRLVQVLNNLIGNAIKYTSAGGHIDVRTGMNDDGVEIVIADDGIGIPPDDLARIFERFYQVDKSRGPARGTGLGLAIAREIIEAHGGKIHIASAGIDQGTTVTVWLPAPQVSTVVNRRAIGV
ncbi:MAG: sensor histidine kinase [Anaerolineae bacterium]